MQVWCKRGGVMYHHGTVVRGHRPELRVAITTLLQLHPNPYIYMA